MNDIKVSVIVPVYNVEKYLKRCVDSLINQTLKEIEIILVDDGSKDNSSQMCDEFAKLDNRIKVIHKENNGLGMARNTGLDNANGEYVAFIDSDDFIELNAFEEMYNRIKNDNTDFLLNDYYKFKTNTTTKTKVNSISENKILFNEDVKKLSCLMIGENPLEKNDVYSMSVWGNLYSRKVIEDNNIRFCSEREFVSEDAIFHLMLVPLLNSVSICDKAYYYYCDNDDVTLTSKFRENKFFEFKKLYLKEIELIKNANLFEYGKYSVASIFLGNTRAYLKLLCHSSLDYKYKRKLTKNIVKDELVKEVLSWYPYKKTTIRQKIFSFLIKMKQVNLLLLLAYLQVKHKK